VGSKLSAANRIWLRRQRMGLASFVKSDPAFDTVSEGGKEMLTLAKRGEDNEESLFCADCVPVRKVSSASTVSTSLSFVGGEAGAPLYVVAILKGYNLAEVANMLVASQPQIYED